MRSLRWVILYAPLVSALAIPPPSSPSQKPLMENTLLTSVRDKVPGDNPAYFLRLNKTEQLFSVEEFTVNPFRVERYVYSNRIRTTLPFHIMKCMINTTP